MHLYLRLQLTGLALALGAADNATEESFTSSAWSAVSNYSGSISASLDGLIDSSSGTEKSTNGGYRITNVAQAPGRDGMLRRTVRQLY